MSHFISFGKTSLEKHFYFDSTQRHNIMGFTVFKKARNVHSACEILDKVRFYLDEEENELNESSLGMGPDFCFHLRQPVVFLLSINLS